MVVGGGVTSPARSLLSSMWRVLEADTVSRVSSDFLSDFGFLGGGAASSSSASSASRPARAVAAATPAPRLRGFEARFSLAGGFSAWAPSASAAVAWALARKAIASARTERSGASSPRLAREVASASPSPVDTLAGRTRSW